MAFSIVCKSSTPEEGVYAGADEPMSRIKWLGRSDISLKKEAYKCDSKIGPAPACYVYDMTKVRNTFLHFDEEDILEFAGQPTLQRAVSEPPPRKPAGLADFFNYIPTPTDVLTHCEQLRVEQMSTYGLQKGHLSTNYDPPETIIRTASRDELKSRLASGADASGSTRDSTRCSTMESIDSLDSQESVCSDCSGATNNKRNEPQWLHPGSLLHSQGLCRPCAHSWKPDGCSMGHACSFCHICGENEFRNYRFQKGGIRSGATKKRMMNATSSVPSTENEAPLRGHC